VGALGGLGPSPLELDDRPADLLDDHVEESATGVGGGVAGVIARSTGLQRRAMPGEDDAVGGIFRGSPWFGSGTPVEVNELLRQGEEL
jgi:hypothetical protein